MVKSRKKIQIERIQTGVRIEKKILKVLKGVSEYNDLSLGQMLELIIMHAFEGRHPFSNEGLKIVGDLKKIYGLDYGVHDYLDFIEGSKT